MTSEPADAAATIRLWPDGPPSPIDNVPDEIQYTVDTGVAAGTILLRNISDPTLTVFTASEASRNGVGIVVIPGGGWTINAWTHEGLDVARWLTGLGYTAFLLKYRVMATNPDQAAFDAAQAAMDMSAGGPLPTAKKPRAISELVSSRRYQEARDAAADDGRRAIQLAREHAQQYGIKPELVGAIGFSAGAFLAVDIAMDPRADQPAFIAPIYGGETRGSQVPPDAPPMFTAVAQDDFLSCIVEGLHADWSASDRPSELHVFRRGGHGFGMIAQGLPSDRWTDLFAAWLDDLRLTT
ncbi:MAG TPA: alpha/beta hydrolase [Acidimicrobiales bacterium]|nr:alpha/beta hydrolase [Acidimicrobiales bacterium]